MKAKIILLIYFFISTKVSCQQLNVMVTIDDVITASYNLSDSYLIAGNDTINLQYEMGRFKIEEKDLEKLQKKSQDEEVLLSFKYFTTCPVQGTYQYALKLKLGILLQKFFLVKVYNFSSYPKTFGKKEGYDFEYISPLGSKGLPNNKKLKRNPCME